MELKSAAKAMFTREHDLVSYRRIRSFPANGHTGDGGENDISWDTVYVSAGLCLYVNKPKCGHRYLVLVGEDNPAFEGVFEFCSISAGGSICMCFLVVSTISSFPGSWVECYISFFCSPFPSYLTEVFTL